MAHQPVHLTEVGQLGMGDRMRLARRAHGLSLRELARRLGVSPSLISQVETGRARPSVNTLYAIASELAVSVDELLFSDARPPGPEAARRARPSDAIRAMPPNPVQRSTRRGMIRLASGVTWERLTTASISTADFLRVTYEVDGASSAEDELQRHSGLEFGYVMSGTLSATIGFDQHVLRPGDSIAFDSMVPHRLANVGDEPVRAIWFVVGRQGDPEPGSTYGHVR